MTAAYHTPITDGLSASQVVMTDTGKKLVSVDYLNQSVKTTGTPAFAGLLVSDLVTGRLPIIGASGRLTSVSTLLYDSSLNQMIINMNAVAGAASLVGTALSIRGADNGQVRFNTSSFGIAGMAAYAQSHARNTSASPQAVQSGDVLLSCEGWGYGATGYSVAPRVMLRGYAKQTWSDTVQGAYLSLWTTPTDSIIPAERVRVYDDGGVRIGGTYTTSPGAGLLAIGALVLPNTATAYRLPVATGTNAIGELAAVGATGEYLRGNTGAIPSWATLNQAAVAGLTTADSPTFVNLTLSPTTSNATGIFYKGADPFIHDYHNPTGGGAIPDGNNVFIGGAGNFTMGSTATSTGHSSYNYGVGLLVLDSNTLGYHNVAFGMLSLHANTEGYKNLALGCQSLQNNTTGNNLVGVGELAGKYTNAGAANQTSMYSIYVGYDARPLADGDINEIVIGCSARGGGSNSAVLGSANITKTFLQGLVSIGVATPLEQIHVSDTVRADTYFNLNGADGATGTFVDKNGNTVHVAGGIITSLT